jgi:hypothetical protein
MSKIAAVWLLTAQLVHVPSGTIVLDDTTELTGRRRWCERGRAIWRAWRAPFELERRPISRR